jgi:hypothetical protein
MTTRGLPAELTPTKGSAHGPLLLAAVSLAGTLSLPSGGMAYVFLLCQIVWVCGHAPRFRTHWSTTGHRIVLATTGGIVGLLLGLAWAQTRTPIDDTFDHLAAGWPIAATVGRVYGEAPHAIAESHFGPLPFLGPCIEGGFACTANFLLLAAATLLPVVWLPERWCIRASALTRWWPVLLAWLVAIAYHPFTSGWL